MVHLFSGEVGFENSISPMNAWKMQLVTGVLSIPKCWERVERSEMVMTECWSSLVL